MRCSMLGTLCGLTARSSSNAASASGWVGEGRCSTQGAFIRRQLGRALLSSSVRRRNGHCDRQARTISSSGRNRGWLRVNLNVTTQSKSRFAFERAPPPSSRAESLSRQLLRSAVRSGRAVVEFVVCRRGLSRCGPTSEIPERSVLGRTSGLRALAVLKVGHPARPNCSLEQQHGRSFGLGRGGSMIDTRCLRSSATLPRAAQLEC